MQASRYFSLEIIKKGVKFIKKKQNKIEIFVIMEKGSSHVWTDVISKPIKLETSATTQMADDFLKINTMGFICL